MKGTEARRIAKAAAEPSRKWTSLLWNDAGFPWPAVTSPKSS